LFLQAAEAEGLIPKLEGLYRDPERNSPQILYDVLMRYPESFEWEPVGDPKLEPAGVSA
jgi:hypothetical protein